MATGTIQTKIGKSSFTPVSAATGIALSAITAKIVGGRIVWASFEVKDDGVVSAYKAVASGFPLPPADVNVNGSDSSGNVFPAYIASASGALVTRKAYTAGTWIRYNFSYVI